VLIVETVLPHPPRMVASTGDSDPQQREAALVPAFKSTRSSRWMRIC